MSRPVWMPASADAGKARLEGNAIAALLANKRKITAINQASHGAEHTGEDMENIAVQAEAGEIRLAIASGRGLRMAEAERTAKRNVAVLFGRCQRTGVTDKGGQE